MKFSARYVLYVYVVVVGSLILYWNALEGNVLQELSQMPLGGKLRTHRELRDFALLFGIWVYPFSVVSAVAFIRQALGEKTRKYAATCLGRATVCLFFLQQFLSVGVWSAVANSFGLI